MTEFLMYVGSLALAGLFNFQLSVTKGEGSSRDMIKHLLISPGDVISLALLYLILWIAQDACVCLSCLAKRLCGLSPNSKYFCCVLKSMEPTRFVNMVL